MTNNPTNTPIDWTAQPAKTIRRAIADALGWDVINLNDAPDGYKLKTLKTWIVLYPHNVLDYQFLRSHIGTTYYTAEDAWLGGDIPNWPNDANAALALPLEDDLFWKIYAPSTYNTAGWLVEIAKSVNDTRDIVIADSDICPGLAIAVCAAWLTYKGVKLPWNV